MTKGQLQEKLGSILRDYESMGQEIQSLQDMVDDIPDPVDIDAEVKRGVAARMRAFADEMEFVGMETADEAEHTPEAPAESGPDEDPAIHDPGTGDFQADRTPRDESGDYVLAETMQQAQAILSKVEAEEYSKPEPDELRLRKYRRHAAEIEAAHR